MSVSKEPIDDEEILYRRIPKIWYTDGTLNHLTFQPTKRDVNGLSLTRAKYKSIEDAARPAEPRPGRQYYIAVVKAGDLRAAGIEPAADLLPEDPGHALLPELNAENRHSNETKELARALATEIVRSVHGPYGSLCEEPQS